MGIPLLGIKSYSQRLLPMSFGGNVFNVSKIKVFFFPFQYGNGSKKSTVNSPQCGLVTISI